MPLGDACVDAILQHWRDREQDLYAAAAHLPLGLPQVAPPVIPPTSRAREKFDESAGMANRRPYRRWRATLYVVRVDSRSERLRICSRRRRI
ncbi:hypothetical protein [Burkholderia latens]|uniref:Uncharacterized protein n=1 Tax=Burkholderia latens TaxID=488446 RepID=A0A6H9SXX5_9BURK|nr:hypothetical protein [Burkholderia latens]KAB0644793.1 hypothetical protein F7R21_00290 [Burkholderia latens]